MQKHPSKKIIGVALALLLGLNLACGLSQGLGQANPTPTIDLNSSGESSSAQAENSGAVAQQPTAATVPAATQESEPPAAAMPADKAAPSGQLAERQIMILPGAEPPTLDPHLSGDANSAEYVVEIFSGLMAYDQDLNLIPDLAESYDISDDGMVYTFKLRDNARFQDGKAITAEDFKWSFERACDPATGSHTADTYLGDIVGCRSKLQHEAKEVKGVQALDDRTVQITIDEPKGFFLAKMTYPTAYVLDKETVENGGADWYKSPNGSGPFMVDTYAPEEGGIVLAKNENYYRDPQPTLERVIFVTGSPINPLEGYTAGLGRIGLDGAYFDAIPVGTANMPQVTDPNNPLSKELHTVNSFSVFYIGFNVNKPPFDDRNIRRAFNLALDKARMVKLVFQGNVPVANGIVPPNMPGYQNPDLSDFEFDPEQALQLIADSPYGDVSELPDITLNVSGAGGSAGPLVEAIVQSYKDNLGVEVNVEQTPWPDFLAGLNNPKMSYQMYQLGWIADYPDPQNFLEVLFHTESTQNHGGYSNPDVDALLDQARGELDSQKRLKLYQQAEQLILEDAAWVPLYFNVEDWLIKPYVQDFQIPPIQIPKFQYVKILADE
ncbi:MAG: Dipeptide-binding protein DppE [Anaerolineae bacterium]|nr:Dipeptide-binding protein DppE [Anaerolineae bacterium]